ncbi:MAG: Rrf2 family transcriptional regulator [Vicinamibacteraceae bacterium]|nr:Rrf2 family transcriptional regulator [Vicinamibacteraceae bacterium]
MLSVTARHALRALTHLAGLPLGQSMGGRDLARAADIPQNYLSKILWALRGAGIIDATRGIGGGYRLRRPAASVSLIEVVEIFDKPRTASECLLDGTRPCSDHTACAAHASWREVKAAYLNFLEHTTIETLATRQSELDSRHPASGIRHPA